MIDSVALAAALVAVIFVSVIISSRQHAQRSTFQAAFGATTMAILCFVTGILGLRLDKHELWVRVTHTGTLQWTDLIASAVFSVCAIYLWRKALRSLT
jgi:membrane protein implicated in regulation of membrane protease activity